MTRCTLGSSLILIGILAACAEPTSRSLSKAGVSSPESSSQALVQAPLSSAADRSLLDDHQLQVADLSPATPAVAHYDDGDNGNHGDWGGGDSHHGWGGGWGGGHGHWHGQSGNACGSAPATGGTTGATGPGNGVGGGSNGLRGVKLNGTELNGVKLNGVKLNGVKLNGVKLNGVKLNGVKLNGVKLNGTALSGTLDGTQIVVTGDKLVGAQLEGVLSNGMSLTITIVHVEQDGCDPTLWYYDATYQDDDGKTYPLCTGDNNEPVDATALGGTWDYSEGTETGGSFIAPNPADPQFTFACQDAALEKCVTYGYYPWLSDGQTSLQPYHQACTRLLRADYCGDGTPNTVDGTAVDLYDGLGIQTDTESHWPFEAEWDGSGARCVVETRERTPVPVCPTWSDGTSHAFGSDQGCGAESHFNSGTLEMDKTLGTGSHGQGNH